MHVRTLRGPSFQGSFPFGNRTLQTRPEGTFSFKVPEGRVKPWRKKGKMQTNKQTKK